MGLRERVRIVLELMRRFDLTELDVTAHGDRVSLRRADPEGRRAAPPPSGEPGPATAGAEPQLVGHALRSPIAGTFFATPRPDADPFVREGVFVSVGDVIGVVEAMKVFNEITADQAGTITRVLVRSGDVVTVDQPLMLLDQRAQATPAAGE